jgi:hypothetical protein
LVESKVTLLRGQFRRFITCGIERARDSRAIFRFIDTLELMPLAVAVTTWADGMRDHVIRINGRNCMPIGRARWLAQSCRASLPYCEALIAGSRAIPDG